MAEAHQEQEADPVEEEGRDKGRAKDKVVAQQGSIAFFISPIL